MDFEKKFLGYSKILLDNVNSIVWNVILMYYFNVLEIKKKYNISKNFGIYIKVIYNNLSNSLFFITLYVIIHFIRKFKSM